MSDLKPFTLYQIGEIQLEDDEESGFTGVVLRGDHDAVRAVAHLFDEPVAIVQATPSLPASAEGGEVTDEIAEKVAEIICQGVLFDGNGHGCGGFCQAKGRFGKVAHDILAALKAETSR